MFGHCEPFVAAFRNKCCSRPVNSFTDCTSSRIYLHEEMFALFWDKVMKEIQNSDVGQPVLPRAGKISRRFETGRSVSSRPKSFYRVVYFEVLDLVINAIKDRFDQPGYENVQKPSKNAT